MPLTEKGKTDAQKAGSILRGIAFDRVYCSDSIRAIETMQIALPNAHAEFTADLRENHVGDLAGLTFDDCRKMYGDAYRQMLANHDFTAVGGEDFNMHYKRVSRFMKRLEQVKDCGNIVVFCHEGTIKCMLSYITHAIGALAGLQIDNGAVCVFRHTQSGWALVQWNRSDPIVTL